MIPAVQFVVFEVGHPDAPELLALRCDQVRRIESRRTTGEDLTAVYVEGGETPHIVNLETFAVVNRVNNALMGFTRSEAKQQVSAIGRKQPRGVGDP